MLYSTPSGVGYHVLPVRPGVLKAKAPTGMPHRFPVVVVLPHEGKLDFDYFRECFDKIAKRGGKVCLLAHKAWIGFVDGEAVVNTMPEHSSRQWRGERFFHTNGNEAMYAFELDTWNYEPDQMMLDKLIEIALEQASRAA